MGDVAAIFTQLQSELKAAETKPSVKQTLAIDRAAMTEGSIVKIKRGVN